MPAAMLLPAFDEWIIGYADRAGLFANEHERKIITTNGIFRPVLLGNGRTVGSWRVTEKKGSITIEKEWFHPVSPSLQKAIKVTERKYAAFRGEQR